MGRDTQGVKAMNLEEGDALVDMLVVDKSKDILTVTALGYGKRTDVEEYRLQGRAGKGIKAGVFNEKTGPLVNMKLVSDEDDVMLITAAGVIMRMHADAVSKIGRNTRGVRVMRVRDSEIATIAIAERDDEAETVLPAETAPSPEDAAEDAASGAAGDEE